jgi:hypothetical protein
MLRHVRIRGPELVVVALAALAQVACFGGGARPAELSDGSPARAPSLTLDRVGSRQIETKAVAVGATSGLAARCVAETYEHTPRGPIVWRVGVDGASITFRTVSGRDVVACDGTALRPGGRRTWCGVALGRMHGGQLLDPRLDLAACSTPSGDPVAFVWADPGPGTRYVAVDRDGFVEVYPVLAGLPVRLAATSGLDLDTSSASFDVSEHDAEGRVLRSYTLRARVAG